MRYNANMKKNPTSHRLSDRALRLLAKLSEYFSVSQTAVIELALRELAKDVTFDVPIEKPIRKPKETTSER